ncbi:mitochondrial carrier domain-containing protein [Polychytrium aggregatum]|uniref:mitochondrial carrier domain-containing protein n=1 Tax=Polychytrium aggregatum TaxID=110093 RepID=UPI0022FE39CC|nr:mitochondrial carrier domain-containing protein [Polychytrium aggregatum]XP_052962823.1 mitochondrial carrier domain-containing protein [Polychytrium aggregatum]KAI9188619.1 mitochondrial carrier domain-containing protein [Polychytrium aggregatum]KAI9197166.1 mitochondrial carrier domain-containing protein [Polychytrium aggregatum]
MDQSSPQEPYSFSSFQPKTNLPYPTVPPQLTQFRTGSSLPFQPLSEVESDPITNKSGFWAEGDAQESAMSSREILVYAGLKFLASALVCPFEAVNILRQIQYSPSDFHQAQLSMSDEPGATHTNHPPDLEQDFEDSDTAAGDQSDPYHLASTQPQKHDNRQYRGPKSSVDSAGYLIQTSFDRNDPTRPAFKLPILEGSAFSSIAQIVRQESLASLWKGQFSHWCFDMSHMFMQPSVETMLNDTFEIADASIPLVHLQHPGPNLTTIVASYALTGFILSPLDLVRTRLIAQTAHRHHRKYKGTLHALSTVLEEEGLTTLYFGTHCLPTLIHFTVQPFFKNATQLIIQRWLRLSSDESPLTVLVAEVGLIGLEIFISMPIETVKRRLQCQVSTPFPKEPKYETMIQQSKIPYTSFWDCFWRIIKEEGGVRVKGRHGKVSRRRGWLSTWGLKGLYKGWKQRLAARILLLLLNTLTNALEDSEP